MGLPSLQGHLPFFIKKGPILTLPTIPIQLLISLIKFSPLLTVYIHVHFSDFQ